MDVTTPSASPVPVECMPSSLLPGNPEGIGELLGLFGDVVALLF